jgi:hypothetical protein
VKRLRAEPERLLFLACLVGALMLIASEFADTFAYRAGGAVLEVSHGGGRHDFAFLLLGVFAIAAILTAFATGSKPAAIAVATTGALALLLFLLIDLPDAGAKGTFAGFVQSKADPQAGYWLELIGAIVLLIGGTALAAMRRPATIPRRAEHESTRTQGT